jgi:hypothetical protein
MLKALFPIKHTFLFLSDTLQGPIETGHMFTAIFQHLLWPKLKWLILGNFPVIRTLPVFILESRNERQTLAYTQCKC